MGRFYQLQIYGYMIFHLVISRLSVRIHIRYILRSDPVNAVVTGGSKSQTTQILRQLLKTEKVKSAKARRAEGGSKSVRL